jgi:hypothetical protein
MMQIPKLKIKVYFYHLFIFAIVMLLCFFLMYKDMKRIEKNVLSLYNKLNSIDNRLLQYSKNIDNLNKPPSNLGEVNNIVDELEDINNNINQNEDMYDKIDDNVVCNIDKVNVDEDVEVDKVDNVEDVEDDESVDREVEVLNEDDEDDKSITIDDDSIDREVEVLNEEVDDLLEDLNNSNNMIDLSSLSREELLDKKNDELRNYLKSLDISTSGNKNQLVDSILENRNDN